MPFVTIRVNQALSDSAIAKLTSTAVDAMKKILEKPESCICVDIEVSPHLTFAGTKDPAAVVTIRSIGFGGNSKPLIIAVMEDVLNREASVPSNRCFVFFNDLAHSDVGYGGRLLA